MNMLCFMVKLSNTCLMIFFLFVSVYGRGEDSSPSCVQLMVRSGTTLKRAPQQSATVSCPVKHCGKSLNITWCKLLDSNSCERINKTENVEIRQDDDHVKNELISYLTFKWITVYDDGLYRCEFRGKYHEISHIINISVSDMHQGDETTDDTDNIAVRSLSAADGEAVTWLPYFYICVGIVLLVFTMTALTLLSFHGWKTFFTETLTFKPTKGQEMSSHMIPDLPKGNTPSTPVLQDHSVLNAIYSPNTAGTPPSPPSLTTNRNQPLANTGDKSHASDYAVYAVINHAQPGIPARKQHAVTKQDNNPKYTTINVS
ncbi:B- and T-lymphocyte attenuator [Seriola aureovittata]|uniref:B- and T-lymphocyte attenuator n=1 Tax=Seriola aureovittata TaxID=2871759 RepID=UPI0024BE5020|nr:B- and T-lymphocyte attenuator [Seriola aureovittata]